MPHVAAGLLMYRLRAGHLQFLLAHPGGPFWQKKDDGAWTIPKGEPVGDEDLRVTAMREFEEETGTCPSGIAIPLKAIKQKGQKVVHAWAIRGDLDPAAIRSNTFTMEWPPRSGKQMCFPEIDRADFFHLEVARRKINPAQVPLLEELASILSNAGRVTEA